MKGPTSVKTDKQMPMVKGAVYIMSTGDEAGSAMGVISNKIKGECEFMMYSFDVKFEGKMSAAWATLYSTTIKTSWVKRERTS